jgi:5-methylcytosine-specific restriction endonuclease McrA
MPKKGYKKTEEHCRKISESLKGKTHSEEAKKKMRRNNGSKRPEVRKKMSDAKLKNPTKYWLGKKRPEMSEGQMGDNNPMKRLDIREKNSKANKGKKLSEETKRKISKSSLGKKKSKQHCENISKGQKGKPKPLLRGEKNYNWKGGITPVYYQIRNHFKTRQWRSDVFTRDNFTCQDCGDNKGGNLEVHHIEELNKIMEKYQIKTLEQALYCEILWNINNGRTLCQKCHIEIHTKC